MSTLTYVYADSTAVVGPLATYAEPHCYDLCQMHTDRLTAPRGWEVVRITPNPDALKPSSDDLEALANAVREAARPRHAVPEAEVGTDEASAAPAGTRRGHLRVVPEVSRIPADTATQRPAAQGRTPDSPPDGPPQGSPPGPAPGDSGDHDRLW